MEEWSNHGWGKHREIAKPLKAFIHKCIILFVILVLFSIYSEHKNDPEEAKQQSARNTKRPVGGTGFWRC